MSLKCLCVIAVSTVLCLAADHKEAPLAQEAPAADIADLYAFTHPQDVSRLVLAMTVNPFSVPEEAVGFNFSSRVRYRFLIDNDGDARADHFITIQFLPDQSFFAVFSDGTRIDGQATPPSEEPEPSHELIFEGSNDARIFAGPRDDPFFFDFVGFSRVLAGTGSFSGSDSFAGYNVSAIVVELPISVISDGSSVLNIWAVTELEQPGGQLFKEALPRWKTLDRMGNPGVATALIPPGLKDFYNASPPNRDAELFAPSIVASLTALGTTADNIGVLASVAVPDLLTIDVSAPSGFPNGRTLDDDVIDVLFHFIFNQSGVTDGVASNDAAFMGEFPFLAAPWQP
ncbi:MAG: DUF4331 family protein [Acidobacteria bacterium]|nr:DUF4331 family protein [Acidobacteriota bacterium]